MIYNIYTQLSGLVITLVILIYFVIQKKMNIKREHRFLRCILSTALVLGLDVAATVLNTVNKECDAAIYVNRAYLLATTLAVLLAALYISGEAFSKKAYYTVFWISVVLILGIGALVMNQHLTTNVATSKANGAIIYTSGTATLLTYISAFICIVYILVISMVREKQIGHKQAISIRIWMGLWSLFAIIQYFFKWLLICSFALSLGIMIMYISIETLESSIDQNTGLFNWHGYISYVNDRKKEKKGCEVVYLKALESISILDDKTLNQALEAFNLCLKEKKGIMCFRIQREYIIILRKISFDHFMEFWDREKEAHPIVANYYYPLYLKDATELENEADLPSLVDIAASGINRTEENFITIDRQMLLDQHKNIETENAIEKAMKEDRIIVYYQPIYNMDDRKFTCAEALVRIQNEDGSILPPGMFIPVAEKNGMIHKLDEIVFDKVCQFISSHDMEALGLSYIEVNLSVAQLCDETLSQRYISIMKKNKTKPCYINLEVTESAELAKRKNLMKNMKALIKYGVTFSLDDYGTGYSNLNYIVDMPISIVKFDKVMVDTYFGLAAPLNRGKVAKEDAKTSSEKAKTLMNTSISMFLGMGLHIVAEGVEKEEELSVLKSLHVTYIQGYLFSRPIPEEEFEAFLNEKNNGIKKEAE